LVNLSFFLLQTHFYTHKDNGQQIRLCLFCWNLQNSNHYYFFFSKKVSFILCLVAKSCSNVCTFFFFSLYPLKQEKNLSLLPVIFFSLSLRFFVFKKKQGHHLTIVMECYNIFDGTSLSFSEDFSM